jgi:carbonic anhydrase/acetyltransferase-like protein (isoleucine patch superfamily)
MLLEHQGKCPQIDKAATIAPTAVISGDVIIGPDTYVAFGAVLTAEGGTVVVGSHCIIMENAVIRGTVRHPVQIGNQVLVGPGAYLTGCKVGDGSFLATGTTIFNGAQIGARSEVRINGVVHLKTVLPPDSLVPIGWVAVGDPAEILPPGEHEKIWQIQKPLNFPKEIFGLERWESGKSIMPEIAHRYTAYLNRHRGDTILG